MALVSSAINEIKVAKPNGRGKGTKDRTAAIVCERQVKRRSAGGQERASRAGANKLRSLALKDREKGPFVGIIEPGSSDRYLLSPIRRRLRRMRMTKSVLRSVLC
jgi:hypothetical protein